MSAIIAAAISSWRACRDAFEEYREAAYTAAHEACSGRLLNRRGRDAGIDSWSLFIGSDTRAYAYASEELVAHWDARPRQTYERFERTWFDRSGEYAA